MNELFLKHHGILGQKWGVKNGPPYPLTGGKYDNRNALELKESRRVKRKRHEDRTIAKGTKLVTLSVDPNRTKDADMFYAAYDKRDVHEYNALFNKKMDQPVYDKDGNVIGSEKVYKFRIENIPNKNLKIASETNAANAFIDLYSKDRDFYNYVTDASRMQDKFVESRYRFQGYREARDVLEKIRSDKDYVPSRDELQVVYRMYNYTIPNLDSDTIKQRQKFFSKVKANGYDGILDTNDALYGGYKAEYPVIIVNQEAMLPPSVMRTSASSVMASRMLFPFIKLMQE